MIILDDGEIDPHETSMNNHRRSKSSVRATGGGGTQSSLAINNQTSTDAAIKRRSVDMKNMSG